MFLYDASENVLRGTYGISRSGALEDSSAYLEPFVGDPAIQRMLSDPKGFIFVPDYTAQVGVPPGHEMHGVKEHLTVAAWAEDKPVAVISVDNVLTGRRMAEEQIEALRLFAGYVGFAIENARLYAAVKHELAERKQAEALSAGQSQMLEMIAASAPLEEVLTSLTLFIEAQSEGMLCSVLLLDEDGQHIRHGAAPSLPQAYFKAVDGSLIGPRAGSCGTAMYLREPVIVTDILHDPLWEDYPNLVALAAQHGLRACWSTPITSHQGTVLGSFAAYYREVRGPNPAETRLIATATDIARIAIERQQAEQTLQESEELYRLITDSSNDTIGLMDFQGLTIFVSPAVRQMMGLDPAQVIGVNAFEYVHPDDQPASLAAFKRALDGETVTFLHRGRHADGTWRWLEGWGRVIQFLGKPHILAVSRDITERKRVEAALQASEERYRALYDDTPSMYFTVDPDGIVLSVNHYGAAYLGYSPEDLIGQSVLRVFVEGDRETAASSVAECLQHPGQMFYLELRKVRKDGSLLWVKETARAVPNRDGELVVLIVCEDITERKQAEEALHESEALYRRAIESAGTVPYHLEHTTRTYRFLGAGILSITGYSEDEMTPKLWLSLVQEKVLGGEAADLGYEEAFRRAQNGELAVWKCDNLIRARDGQMRWIADSAVQILNEQGKAVTSMGILQDITERKHAEEALRKSEQRYHGLFEDSPISIWEEDFSLVKQRLDLLRLQGVEDFAAFFDDHPEVLAECASQIKVVDINNATLKLFDARTKNELRENLVRLIKNDNFEKFQDELIKIANGILDFQWEEPARTLAGDQIYINFRWSVAPGHEDTLSRVIISIIDITQRKQHERELGAIVTVSAALRTAPTRAEMLPVILDQLLDLLRADGTAFAIRDPGSGETVFELGLGDFANSTGLHIPAGIGMTGYVIATGQPYLNKDIRSDPRFVRPEELGNIRAVACVPLIAQGQSIGALLVGRKTEVSEQEVRLLTSIGDIAANAIHRASLFEQTKRRLEHLAALNDIDKAITSSFDLQSNLTMLLTHVIAQLSVDAADVLLFNPGSQTLEYSTGRGFDTKAIEHTRLSLGQGYAGKAALERRTIDIPESKEPADDFVRKELWVDEAFVSYYAMPLTAKGQIKGVLEVFKRARIRPDEEWLSFLNALAEQATIAIDNATLFEDLQRSNTELAQAYDATIEGWSRALDLRDKETEGHTQRVTALTLELAKAMGVADRELVHIRRGALLHDIGKMGVPDHILLKPDALTEEEWVQMQKHPAYANDMLSDITFLYKALDIPYCHHENWDGSGYPRGLKGNDIPLATRIFSVADVYDALSSDHPYRAGWPRENVLEHIQQQSGTRFDPQVVDVF